MVYRRNARTTKRKREAAAAKAKPQLLCEGIGAAAQGLVVFTPRGVRCAVHSARDSMADHFNSQLQKPKGLPNSAQTWSWFPQALSFSKNKNTRGTERPTECAGRRLSLRCVRIAGRCLLLLDGQQTTLQTAALKSIGLTQREAEVLAWASQGKSNKEVGSILALSARTVGKHLEHIYSKLGVESRTAAAARVFDIAATSVN